MLRPWFCGIPESDGVAFLTNHSWPSNRNQFSFLQCTSATDSHSTVFSGGVEAEKRKALFNYPCDLVNFFSPDNPE
jgi:hypothetical protein